MAITRVESLKVSNLNEVIRHRMFPDERIEKCLVFEYMDYLDDFLEKDFWKIYANILKYTDYMEYQELSPQDIRLNLLVEMFKAVESKGYKHKIRKNSTIQEIIIAYSKDDFKGFHDENDIISEIRKDVDTFFKSFKEKYGFFPFSFYSIHKDDNNKYHVHIVFSLMKPELDKKVRWRKRDYFDIINKMSKQSKRIPPPTANREIGAYPLWIIRVLEMELAREKTKLLIEEARKKRIKTPDLINILYSIRTDSSLQEKNVKEILEITTNNKKTPERNNRNPSL